MLVANSFDLWQKDAFFSAAEEVQKSADTMESAYRRWVRARREGLLMSRHLDALERELQMALGTAKWQLEELERAIRLSHTSHGDCITITRHSQFVSAIEEQITKVEKAFSLEGKKPLRWVNLNVEECDDFALFLSGTSSQMTSEEKNYTKEVRSEMQMTTGNEDDIGCQVDRASSNQRMWGSQEKGTLEIVVIDGDDDDGEKNTLLGEICEEKASNKPSFWSTRDERVMGKGGFLSCNNSQFRMISWVNQRLRGQRKLQMSPVLPVNSIRFILALMLTIFLVVPFLVYSNGAMLSTMDD